MDVCNKQRNSPLYQPLLVIFLGQSLVKALIFATVASDVCLSTWNVPPFGCQVDGWPGRARTGGKPQVHGRLPWVP